MRKINLKNYKKIIVLYCVSMMALTVLPFGEALANQYGNGEKGRQAVERFVLDVGPGWWNGRSGRMDVLELKRALKRQYPGLDVSDYRLRTVKVVAKSQYGRGTVRLSVGPTSTGLYMIGGNPRSFHGQGKKSFDTVRIESPFRDSWGPWNLEFRGNIKVRQVVLMVERRCQRKGDWQVQPRPVHPRHPQPFFSPHSSILFHIEGRL